MQTLINIIVFVLVLTAIILVHELGHFLAAKSFGVFCGEFSIGMGPVILKKKGKETLYTLRALPVGGFVAMAGEADQEDNELMKNVPVERTLKGLSTIKQVIIMSAGIFMNFVLAICLLVGVYSTSAQASTNSIATVVEGSTAETLGLEVNDIIKEISFSDLNNIFVINDFSDVSNALNKENNGISSDSTTINLLVSRNGNDLTLNGKITLNEANTSFYLGISPNYRKLSFMESLQYAKDDFVEMSTLVFTSLAKLVTDTKNTIPQLSGPAGIYQVTSEVTETGNIASILLLVALLSINVGIFNLMPIPGLDGSQILFSIIERIMGREIPTKIRYYLQLGGLILVFGLMIIVTFNDLLKIF